MVLMTCSAGLASCILPAWIVKSPARQQAATNPLIKPAISDKPEAITGRESAGDAADKDLLTKGTKPQVDSRGSALAAEREPGNRRTSDEFDEDKTDLKSEGRPSTAKDQSQEGTSSKKKEVSGVETAIVNPGSEKSASTAKGNSEEFPLPNTQFQRPDHAKYDQKIRNKAIDVLNKGGLCTLARLCKDSLTEKWSLTLYRKGEKSYSFVVYSWDPVGSQWERAYVSGSNPISRWEHHLKYSAGGKECRILKGTEK
jgi:hypothetical protein